MKYINSKGLRTSSKGRNKVKRSIEETNSKILDGVREVDLNSVGLLLNTFIAKYLRSIGLTGEPNVCNDIHKVVKIFDINELELLHFI